MKQIAQFEMTLHRAAVKGEKLAIQPFGDVHRFSPACHTEKWKAFLKWSREKHDDNTLYLCLGDHTDMMSIRERNVMLDVHESTTEDIDNLMLSRCRQMVAEMEFMRRRFIGMVEGNHYWQFSTGQYNGMTSTQVMARMLGTKWLGSIGYVHLEVEMVEKGAKIPITIVATHGRAGGKLLGTTINQVADLKQVFPSADIYMMGHDHHRGGLPESHLYVKNFKGKLYLKQRRQWFARTGSFLKGYEEGVTSYVVQRLLRPADLGVVRFEIDFVRKREKGNKNHESVVPDIHMWS